MSELTYDPVQEVMSDGCWIDWFVYEPVDSCFVCSRSSANSARPHLRARLDTIPPDCILVFPVARFEHASVPRRMRGLQTVSDLLHAIHAFYEEVLTPEEVTEHAGEHDDGYAQDAVQRAKAGEVVTRLDLIGSRTLFCEPGGRRHPLMCSGRVRYEGLAEQGAGGVFLLALGS